MLASYSADNMDEGVINLVSSIFFEDENNEIVVEDEEDIVDIIDHVQEDDIDCDFLPFSKEFLEMKRERAFSWDVSFEQSVTHEIDDIAAKQALLFDHDEEPLVIKTSNKRKIKTDQTSTTNDESISKRSRSSNSRRKNDNVNNTVTPISNNMSTPRAPGRRKSNNNNNINEYDIIDVFATDNETNRNTQSNKYTDKVSKSNNNNNTSNINSTVKNISWSSDVHSPKIKVKVTDPTPTTVKVSTKARGRTPPTAAAVVTNNSTNSKVNLPMAPALPFSVPIQVPATITTSITDNNTINNNEIIMNNTANNTTSTITTTNNNNTLFQLPTESKAIATTMNNIVIDENNLITPLTNSYIVNEALIGVDGRIGAYTKDERRIKIDKFRERKRSRIWRKQIKYDCRKRLADTRPRVKGRFVSRKGEDGKSLPPECTQDIVKDISIENNSINSNHIQPVTSNGTITNGNINNNNTVKRRNSKKSVGNNNNKMTTINGTAQLKQIHNNQYPGVNNTAMNYNPNTLPQNNTIKTAAQINNINNNNKVNSTAGYSHIQQSGGYGVNNQIK